LIAASSCKCQIVQLPCSATCTSDPLSVMCKLGGGPEEGAVRVVKPCPYWRSCRMKWGSKCFMASAQNTLARFSQQNVPKPPHGASERHCPLPDRAIPSTCNRGGPAAARVRGLHPADLTHSLGSCP
jgi:hypothetical protein